MEAGERQHPIEFPNQLISHICHGLCHIQNYHVEKKFLGQLVTSAIEWGEVTCLGKNARIG